MSFEVIATNPFKRKLKKLTKKHQSLKSDLLLIIEESEYLTSQQNKTFRAIDSLNKKALLNYLLIAPVILRFMQQSGINAQNLI